MAITKVVTVEDIRALKDGQLIVKETVKFIEDGAVIATTTLSRRIDVGDDVRNEDDLIKKVVNGNLHDAARKAAREAVKAAGDTI
jgi:hypothetical protein